MMEEREQMHARVEALPRRPGVYLMRDAAGKVIYVGKATDLRSRVRSYFHASASHSPKVEALVGEIADLDFIVTDSELEALILEANLIKEHRPRYNVRFKDDKRYPYIKVTWSHPYPKVFLTRRMERDGSRYFGPFTSAAAVHRTLDLLRRSFPYLTCSREITGLDQRACLYYDINLCPGPCIGAVTQEEYRASIRSLIRVLEGHSEQVIQEIETRLSAASDELRYEDAAALRDQLRSVRLIIERQKVVTEAGIDQDVIAFAREDDDACVQVFFIRGGKLLGREYFVLQGAEHEEEREVLTAFLKQFYDEAAYVPPEVLLPEQIAEATIIEEWLKSKRGAKVALRVPRRGRKRELVRLAAANAAETLAALRVQWEADAHRSEEALAELQEALGLAAPPVRIECYDISTTQGTEIVGSMVVFVHGVPRKSHYRRFVVRTVQGQDDYASMREVLERRFRRWRNATSRGLLGSRDIKGWAKLPDLLVVDGGRGQLGVALEVLEEFGLRGKVPTIGLAKEREEVYVEGRSRPIVLPRRSQGRYLLQRARDEAHRFAITHHRGRRRKVGVASQLDSIPGVGPARRRALLKAFRSLDGIREAPVEKIAAVPGISRSLAAVIKKEL
jgi:excinuclease ABC subunit C